MTKNLKHVNDVNDLFYSPGTYLSVPRFQVIDPDIPSGIKTIKVGGLPINKRYPPSIMEYWLSGFLFPSITLLLISLLAQESKIPLEWIATICLPFLIAIYMNVQKTKPKNAHQDVFAIANQAYSSAFIEAQAFHRQFNAYSQQMTDAVNESHLPAKALLNGFIDNVNAWLKNKQSTTKQIHLQGLVKQLNIESLLTQRDQKMWQFCNQQELDLYTTIKDGFDGTESIREFSESLKSGVYSTPEYSATYPTITLYMNYYCEQMATLERITIQQNPILMSEQAQHDIIERLKLIRTRIANATSLTQLLPELAGSNAIQRILGQAYVQHPILCALILNQHFFRTPITPQNIIDTANNELNRLYSDAVTSIIKKMIPSGCNGFIERNLHSRIPSSLCGFFRYPDYMATKQQLRRIIDGLPNEGTMVCTKRALVAYLNQQLPDHQPVQTQVTALRRA